MSIRPLLEDLATQKTFKFGKPWRLSDKNMTIVVPICNRKQSIYRNYYVAEEVKDKIMFEDTGMIERVKATNNSDKPVFIRSGSALSGKGGTQDRAVSYGTVLYPNDPKELVTVCIHQTLGIQPRAHFVYDSLVPQSVHQHVQMRSQSNTWSSVQNYTSSFATAYGGTHYADNLIGNLDASNGTEAFKQTIDNLLSKIPANLKNQVGIVVLDGEGVLGIELFDHEDSWTAFSKSIIKSYSEVLTKENANAQLFELKMSKVIDCIIAFLEQLKQATEKSVVKMRDAETYSLTGNIVGEFTVLHTDITNGSDRVKSLIEETDSIIHFMVTRKEKETPKTPRPGWRDPVTLPSDPVYRSPITPQESFWTVPNITYQYDDNSTTPTTTNNNYLRRKGVHELFTYLNDSPKTFGELHSNINVSNQQLSDITKEGIAEGYLEKKLRKNGSVVYSIKGGEVHE